MSTHRMDRSGEGEFAVQRFRVWARDHGEAGLDATSDGHHPLRVGRSEQGNQMVLRDERVSRFHCELTARAEGVVLRDLGSTNGTCAGAVRLHGQEAWLDLTNPVELSVGGVTLRVASEGAAALKTSHSTNFGGLVGTSPVMRALFAELEALCRSTLPVLLIGEPGVGKELAARALHDEGPRAREPFVVIDCSALTPTLLESELFGHEKGAYTGATAARESPFVTARAGTVFLDEIGELPLEAQSRLLRVLQEREVRAVGGGRVRKIQARLVCATNRDLFHEIERGRFREDLFHRLAGIEVEVPPLRERSGQDFDQLVERIIEGLRREEPSMSESALPDEVRARMRAMRWPGNVRELRMAVQRYFVVSRIERRGPSGGRAAEAREPERSAGPERAPDATTTAWPRLSEVLDAAEAVHVRKTLEQSQWNQTRAAAQLDVSRMTLITKMKKYGIKPSGR
jgi:transcriptional regulator with GAF, ATPase, and Fis domain